MRSLATTLALLLLCATAARASEPDVAEIVRRLAANSSDPAMTAARNSVVYDRESRVDYLNDEDEVRKRVVRKYLVAPVNGQPVTRLISVNGQPASEEMEGRRSKGRETGDKSRSIELSEDLLSRYDFKFGGEETLEGRRTWKLHFSPKAGIEADGFFERLLCAMSGVMWVDAEEGQLAKAEIFLSRKVSFFGGIAGAIERINVTFAQRRIEPNLWLGESAYIDFAGRKLFSSIRFRCYETYSEFRKAEADEVLAGAGQ